MGEARTRECLGESLDKDENRQGRENDEGEQWTPVEGQRERSKCRGEVLQELARHERGCCPYVICFSVMYAW